MAEKASHRDDPGGWESTVERRPGAEASVIVSVRFSRSEIGKVRKAAAVSNEKTSEFVRNAALVRAHGGGGIEIELTPSISAPIAGIILTFTTPTPRTEPPIRSEFTQAVTTAA